MSWLYHYYIQQLIVFMLVLARISGLTMTAPIFGTQEVPMNVRALLTVALAVLIAPLQMATPLESPSNVVELLILTACEALIGLILGLGIMLLFSGVQIAGQIISQMSGLSLADVFNPGFDDNVPVIAQLFYFVTLAVFAIIGGHRRVLGALLGTFQAIPPGGGHLTDSIAATITTLLTHSFALGIRAAAPTMTALLLATVILGLVSRTLPQLNVLAIGFGINSLITLTTLSVSLAAIAWAFQEQVDPLLETLVETMSAR